MSVLEAKGEVPLWRLLHLVSNAVCGAPPRTQTNGFEHDPEKWMPVFRKDPVPPKI
jgi:hypothetical protein